eukprot:jgi/Botrbrau1/23585/Bobra.0141s0049.1
MRLIRSRVEITQSMPGFSLCRKAQSSNGISSVIVKSEASSRSARGRSAPRRQHAFSLVRSLVTQVQKETIPFFRDLAQPLLEGSPPPLTDTVSPEELGDEDSRFIDVHGVRLHYKERGPQVAGAPAILLLHGWNGSVLNWEGVMEDLAKMGVTAEGCRVIAFDRPPFGLSQRPLSWPGEGDRNPYTVEGGARLAEGLADALGVGRLLLVGHSAGAPVAAHVALRNPERVAGLCGVGPCTAQQQGGRGLHA